MLISERVSWHTVITRYIDIRTSMLTYCYYICINYALFCMLCLWYVTCDISILHIFIKFSKTEDNFYFIDFSKHAYFLNEYHWWTCKNNCYETCKGNLFILRFVCDSKTNTNHHNLELLTLTKTKITEIKNSFNFNEVKYRKLISSFVETDCYVTGIIYALSFYHPLIAQDVIH